MTENPTAIAPPAEATSAEAAPAPPTMRGRYDVIVIGGGIVGLATAPACSRRPDLRSAVLEKEAASRPTRPATTAGSSTPVCTTRPAR